MVKKQTYFIIPNLALEISSLYVYSYHIVMFRTYVISSNEQQSLFVRKNNFDYTFQYLQYSWFDYNIMYLNNYCIQGYCVIRMIHFL